MGTKLLLLSGALICSSLLANVRAQTKLPTAVDVLMNRYDLQRTGANLSETILNASNVNSQNFGKLWSYTVGGQVYAQPLYVSDVAIPNVGIRNVVYIADMHNDIYCFDADDQSLANNPYWQMNYGNSVPLPNSCNCIGNAGGPYEDIRIEIGILSTPAIDKNSNTIYFVTKTEVGSLITDSLHALDLSTGQPKFGGSQLIAATVPGTGWGTSTVSFVSNMENQRSGLLLYNGIVYICYAGYADATPYNGWIFGYNAGNINQQSMDWCLNPNGQYDGIWMSGAGPSIDTAGNFYVTTGTGQNGVYDLGEAFLKLTPNLAQKTFTVTDFFAPYNQLELDSNDLDLGSSGAVLIPNSHLMTSAGKAGIIYLVDCDSMGGFNPGTDPSADHVLQQMPVLGGELMGTVVYWGDSASNPYTGLSYWWSNNDQLKVYRINNLTRQIDTVPYALGSTAEWSNQPGGIMSLSANGSESGSGILWASLSTDDAGLFTRPGVLRAYDANTLDEIWNTTQNANRDSVGSFAKFNPPVVVNGKLFLATFSGTVNVYGMLNALPVVYESFTAARQGTAVHLQWTTANENNNDYFRVLRSANGSSNFTTIGTVQSKGNSSLAQDYSFDDLSPLNGMNYYRLQQIDLDGHSTYSSIVSIDMDLVTNLYIQVYPNPAHDHVTIACNGLNAGDKIGVEMFNSAGSLVYRQDATLDGDLHLTIQRAPSMFTGVYFIRLTLPSGEIREERLVWGS